MGKKSFDGAAYIGQWFDKSQFPNINDLQFQLTKTAVVQNDTTANMIWGIDEIISHISSYFTLKTGDILFTGTPSGVGLVQKGDELTGQLAGQRIYAEDQIMQAEIITIGDEILIGQIVDSNSAFLAKSLNTIGIEVSQITSVSDTEHAITNAMEAAQQRVSFVLLTGGLDQRRYHKTAFVVFSTMIW